jgi:hypothetical protein
MFLAKLTQTSLLSLGSSKAIVNSADLLAASIGSDIVAAEANAKRTRESARPHKRIDWTPAIDVALEEIDLSVSSAIAREIGLSIG